jgi:hypothetical protein
MAQPPLKLATEINTSHTDMLRPFVPKHDAFYAGPSWETIVAAVILNIFPLVTVFGILAFQLDRHAKRG